MVLRFGVKMNIELNTEGSKRSCVNYDWITWLEDFINNYDCENYVDEVNREYEGTAFEIRFINNGDNIIIRFIMISYGGTSQGKIDTFSFYHDVKVDKETGKIIGDLKQTDKMFSDFIMAQKASWIDRHEVSMTKYFNSIKHQMLFSGEVL